jgi:hypothetical protein
VNEEGSHGSRGGHPQPAFLAGLFPTGLIDVLDFGFLHGRECLGVSRLQGRAHLLLQGGDGAQADGSAEDVGTDLLGGPFGHMVLAGQVGEGGGQARPATVGAVLLRNAGPRDFAATGTRARVPLVLGDFGQQRRQLGDLMPRRRRLVGAGVGRQRRLA